MAVITSLPGSINDTRVGFLPYSEFVNRYYGRRSIPFDYSQYVDPDFSSYVGPVNLEEYYKQYLGQTIPIGYSPPNAGITAVPQAQEQGQIVKDADTSFGNVQTHFDQNQMLKEAVSRGDITPEQYNELGG